MPKGAGKAASVWVVYVLGLVWRAVHLFYLHPAGEYIYSDMLMYRNLAARCFASGYRATIADTTHPPGAAYFFGAIFRVDPSFTLFQVVQFLLAAAIPLLVAVTARALYGRREARIALIAASLYFPFIDYAGYLLAENPYLFFLSVGMALAAIALARAPARFALAIGLAAASGCAFALAAAFKSAALLCPLGIAATGILLGLPRRRFAFAATALACATATAASLVPLAVRCTRLSEGRFCVVANDWGRNVLLGHHGAVREARFVDRARGSMSRFVPPAAVARGYKQTIVVPAGAYDNAELVRQAWQWTRRNPWQSLGLSLNNVADLFVGTLPWPSGDTRWRRLVQVYQWLFVGLVAPGALAALWAGRRPLLRLDPAAWPDLVLLMPILGLIATAFLLLGEPRYRIPFDGLFMILAIRGYTALLFSKGA